MTEHRRWEFRIVRIPATKRGEQALADWADAGWEIVSITEVPETPRRLTVVLKTRIAPS